MQHLAHGISVGFNYSRFNAETWTWREALQLYRSAWVQGWLGQLFNLAETEASSIVGNRYSAGVQTVPIQQIRVGHGRCCDEVVESHDQKISSSEPITLSKSQLQMAWCWDGGTLKASWKSTSTGK